MIPDGVIVPCHFCDSPAIGVFCLPRGCVVFPDDRKQALCAHHALRATTHGGIELAEDLTAGGAFGKLWWGEGGSDAP